MYSSGKVCTACVHGCTIIPAFQIYTAGSFVFMGVVLVKILCECLDSINFRIFQDNRNNTSNPTHFHPSVPPSIAVLMCNKQGFACNIFSVEITSEASCTACQIH